MLVNSRQAGDQAVPTAEAQSRFDYLLLAFSSACIIFLRNPAFFARPRIWAEEGSIYLQNALEKTPLSAFTEPHLGYYSLFNNAIAGLVAGFVPLEFAAHFTTAASALFQVLTVLVIFSSSNRLIASRGLRAAVSLTPILFCAPGEWLNTISMQFWMATATLFILGSDFLTSFSIVYLGVSFMTGVSSLLFLPFFARKLLDQGFKNTRMLISVVLGLLGVAVQLASISSLSDSPSTHSRLKIEYLPNIIGGIHSMIPLGGPLGVLFVALALACSVILIRKGFKKEVLDNIVAPISLYSLISIIASLNMAGGARYAMPVYCGISAIILAGLRAPPRMRTDTIMLGIAGLLLLAQLKSFFNTSGDYNLDWPNWKQQLEQRDFEKDMNVMIFPQWKGWRWSMRIPAGTGVRKLGPPE